MERPPTDSTKTFDYAMLFIRAGGKYLLDQIPRKLSDNTTENGRGLRGTASQIPEQSGNDQTPKSSHEANLSSGSPNYCQFSTQEVGVGHRSSHDTTPQEYKGNESDDVCYGDKRDHKIKTLETELGELRKDHDRCRRSYTRIRKERDEVRNKLGEVHKERDKLQGGLRHCCKQYKEFKSESRKRDEVYHKNYRLWEEKQDGLKKSYDAAQVQIAKQKIDISELTVEISRSVKTNGTTTRGDDHFETRFASLEGALRQWVFRSFRGISGLKHQDLLPAVLSSLEATVFGYNAPLDSKVSQKEIEAAVAERLCTHVFHPTFVLAIQEKYYDIDYITKALGGTGLEIREWHAQTVGMILEKDHYDDHLCHNICEVEKDLQDCFSFLLRGDGEGQRRKQLHAIVEQAAKLQVEVFRQVSRFKLGRITPGERYDPSLMDDMSSLVDEGEVEEGGTQTFIVRVVIFPPVLRFGFDEDDNESDTVVVRKGTVITMRSED